METCSVIYIEFVSVFCPFVFYLELLSFIFVSGVPLLSMYFLVSFYSVGMSNPLVVPIQNTIYIN